MRSVALYSIIQTISWMRFIFLLLAFIASAAYAAPTNKNAAPAAKEAAESSVKVSFLSALDLPLGITRGSHSGQDSAVKETPEAQRRVSEVLKLVGPSLSLPAEIKWSEKNFYNPNLMAGKDIQQMAFFHLLPSRQQRQKYYAWIAYGRGGKEGALTYASVMQVQVVENEKKVYELARVTGKTYAERKQWSYLHDKFWSAMTAMKGLTFVPLQSGSDAIKDAPAAPADISQAMEKLYNAPLTISFVTYKREVMTMEKPSDKDLKNTEAMKWETQRVLQAMKHALHLPESPLPNGFFLWAENTVYKTAPMTFLRVIRAGVVAYAWIAHVDTGHGNCVYASIMEPKDDNRAIQELARAMDLKDVDGKKWKELNDVFLVEFFGGKNGPFKPAPRNAWSMSPLSDKSGLEVLSNLPSNPVNWAYEQSEAAGALLQMKNSKNEQHLKDNAATHP
ncbi:hypothetical protein BDP27DRAFT_1361424 [Rhodocollybia butyracea]|uniref:Uncharacterized protein n=1 Tax=Rhodocollybia butyracea TaxID=206335 RepID=A0A9P5UAG6_9AGAR|nr:hypothetical protein BDP27DRAFT_1361424 [Rhodocollybia butyracea]